MSDTHPDEAFVCALHEDLAADASRCGGKSVGLHRLIEAGLPVPPGFCVTTAAFEHVVAKNEAFLAAIRALDALDVRDHEALRQGSLAVREAVLSCALPDALERSVRKAWGRVTGASPVAVRSSATAEDLADASFAGQQDTYLGVASADAVLEALHKCWASLFSERAVAYRRGRGVASDGVSMAVVVQRMVNADAAGVLFTADPVRGKRTVMLVEAVRGLGEALVSGHVTPERYQLRSEDYAVLERFGAEGETLTEEQAILRDGELAELASMGARAARFAGFPQDLEWAREGGKLWMLQTRAITTLWPLPEGEPPPGLRAYVSIGHGQMNTAPISRAGMSMFARFIPFFRGANDRVSPLVRVAGERMFIDATPALANPRLGKVVPTVISNVSESIGLRLEAVRDRSDFATQNEGQAVSTLRVLRGVAPMLAVALRNMTGDAVARRDAYVKNMRWHLAQQVERTKRVEGTGKKIDVMLDEIGHEIDWVLVRGAFPIVFPVIGLTKGLEKLVPGLVPGADHWALLQGLEGNVTTEMDFALADLADVARDVPALAEALRSSEPARSVEALRGDPACARFFEGWDAFLREHGHRSAGEIDPGVARWREDPRVPLKSIAGALDRPKGALRAQHAALAKKALALRDELVEAMRKRPFGFVRARVLRSLIDRARLFHGVREEHKYALIHTIAWVREVVLEAGALLAERGVIPAVDDVWMLDLYELRDLVRAVEAGASPDVRAKLDERRASRARYANVQPPAVYTSDGEITAPARRAANTPPGALAGTPVSSGTYEGVVRVVHDPNSETLAAGEVLVTRFTDPGWTPLFGHAGALVMEVGGQMTHGSVVARELGIPAVVAVEGATTKLRTGSRVRVDGDRGLVTVLEKASS